MKNLKNNIKKIFTEGCVIYTFLITLMYVIGIVAEDNGNFIPRFKNVWILLGISFVLSAAERFLDTEKPVGLRIGAHFTVSLAGFLVIFGFIGGYFSKASFMVIGTFMFIVAYFLINAFRFILMARRARKNNENEEYTKSFQ